jgi:hypothetical protein
MKTKPNLISSNTYNYIVYIPKNFRITEDNLTEQFIENLSNNSFYIKDHYPSNMAEYERKNFIEFTLEKVNEIIDIVRNNTTDIDYYSIDGLIVFSIVESFDLIIEQLDCSDAQFIYQLDVKTLKRIMKKYGDDLSED